MPARGRILAAATERALVRYELEVDQVPCTVEIATGQVRLNGRELHVDDRPGHLLLGTRSVAYQVVRNPDGTPRAVVLLGKVIPVRYLREGQSRQRREGASDGTVKAPMNGVVVRMLAHAGEAVKAGQVVLVLEAMKMENEVAAPVAGRLTEVAVQAGQTVNPGEPLFTVGKD